MFAPVTFLSLLSILKPLGNGNRHLLLAHSAHICNHYAPGSHNRPWETERFDLQILRDACTQSPKIKERFTGLGSVGWKEEEEEKVVVVVVVVKRACRIVSTGFLWFSLLLAVRVR